MPSLTRSAEVSRLVIKIGIISLVSLMVGRAVISGIYSWWRTNHPDIPPPTIGFGLLPVIEFPQKERPQLTYTLETVTGTLPELGTQADVMQIPAERPNLLAMDRAVQEANSLGFKSQPEKMSDLSYRWRQASPVPATLTMLIYDGRFIWNAEWSTNPNFLLEKRIPAQKDAIGIALNMVNKLTSTNSDLTTSTAKVTYLKGLNGQYQSALSLSDADFVQVDLFRSTYKGQYAFVTPSPDQGIVRVIVSGNNRLATIVQALYNYFPVDYEKVETYPLRTSAQAWQDLLDGKGFVANVDTGATNVIVRDVELAYYDSFEPQHYMQPVYVFSGDHHFKAYIPAISDPKKTTE